MTRYVMKRGCWGKRRERRKYIKPVKWLNSSGKEKDEFWKPKTMKKRNFCIEFYRISLFFVYLHLYIIDLNDHHYNPLLKTNIKIYYNEFLDHNTSRRRLFIRITKLLFIVKTWSIWSSYRRFSSPLVVILIHPDLEFIYQSII